MFRKNKTNMLKILSIMSVLIVLAGTAFADNGYTVTVMPESSTTWYAGYLEEEYQSESDDPLAPFGGQSVMFKGCRLGGSSEMLNGAYLVCRYKIEFDQDVRINSVAITGAGDNTTQGNSAVLRLLDENMNEITVELLTGLNMLLTYKLNTGGVLGSTFYIDEFDYSTNYRYRKYIEIVYDDFEVTNTDDSGPGSLRQAIVNANANPGPDFIAFNISSRSSGQYTIQPTSPLPEITDPVIIDGYTQPGASPNTNGPGLSSNAVLKIELDGSMAGANFVHGLHIITGSSIVRGMVINRFSGNGIAIFGNEATGNLVEGNFIGTDVSGTVDLGNSTDGVQIRGAANNTIGGTTAEARNVISGNNVCGISIQGGVSTGGRDATGNLVQGNLIGTDVTGTAALGNTQDGVQIRGAANNTIGGATAGARNVISGNNTGGGWGGITIINHPTLLITGATGNLVQGNFIGTDVTGNSAIGKGSRGVIIQAAANNTLTDNTISNNRYGIRLVSSSDNQIYNNNFIDNSIQASATGRGGNIFSLEKPIGGNYWSDRTKPDADGDGFVDYTYVFTGGVDYLPWARQDGWLPPSTLSEALDTDLSFTTYGNADWLSQTVTYYSDGDAARSGDISHNEESWMQTTVSGAGTVAFYWNVSSEAGYDFLEFYIDGSLEDQISGLLGEWEQKTYTISTLDSHTLEWRYVKDKGTDSGSDCGWIDKVEWVPTHPPAPLSLAFNPNPADGAEYVYPDVELSWSPGDGAQLHIVHFGDNFDDVNSDAGGILLETTTYTPGPLELDKVYYWRVDEFDGVVIHKGEVWSFTVIHSQ